jgi:hypothetical protein
MGNSERRRIFGQSLKSAVRAVLAQARSKPLTSERVMSR